MTRLDKQVAKFAGLSRRQATAAIRQGRIAVDTELERDPHRRVATNAVIALDGTPLVPPPRVAVWNKPRGVQCTVRDPLGRACLATTAADLLELGLHPVGRLDADTSGLLLWTVDGRLTQHLLHPKRAIERVYRAGVIGVPGAEAVQRLTEGVLTGEGVVRATVRSVEGETITLAVTEGKHRMVRRMLFNVGHEVLDLERLAYGPFTLGDLEPEAWRYPHQGAESELIAGILGPQ